MPVTGKFPKMKKWFFHHFYSPSNIVAGDIRITSRLGKKSFKLDIGRRINDFVI